MAQPILHSAPPRDPRAELASRLEHAPAEHADALLAAYEVLQGLHDAGMLDMVRGALGSREKVLDIAVGATATPAGTRAIRNFVILFNMLAAIDPALLKSMTEAVPRALDTVASHPERPGLWTLIKDFLWNQDFRHGMSAVNTMIEELGRGITHAKDKPGEPAATR